MRHDGEQLVARARGPPSLLVETSVVECEGSSMGYLLGENEITGGVAPTGFGKGERDRAEQPAAGRERDDHHRLEPGCTDEPKVIVTVGEFFETALGDVRKEK